MAREKNKVEVKKTSDVPAKRGRKKKPVKKKSIEETIEELASYGASNRSIAVFYGMNETTLKRNYESFLTKGRETLIKKIKKKQIQVALKGNPTMLIWCGKQYAGQADKPVSDEDRKLPEAVLREI
jgi:hypothetical protein